MDKIEKIREMVLKGCTNKIIGEEIGHTPSYVCKLMKKNNITRPPIPRYTNCGICDINLGNNKRNRSNCKRCSQRISRYRRKIKCVNYKGGCCEKCGYDKYLSALEFHHRNPTEKEFQISKIMCNDFEVVKEELDKCDLLCANCHSEVHNNYSDNKLLDYINNG